VFYEKSDGTLVSGSHSKNDGSVAIAVPGIRIGAAFDKEFHHCETAELGGKQERSKPVVIPRFEQRRIVVQQCANTRTITGDDRIVYTETGSMFHGKFPSCVKGNALVPSIIVARGGDFDKHRTLGNSASVILL
jgi:hypothetical protein